MFTNFALSDIQYHTIYAICFYKYRDKIYVDEQSFGDEFNKRILVLHIKLLEI